MSFLLTSLILCLFQTPQPELSMKQSEGAYTKAMHLIDVRGKYLEGAEILESIADAEDVIWFPGQSSWILAQAARAFTLAGKPELASMDLDLIRDASRGTRFEEPVQALLLSFASQGAGLDEEFLDHIWSHLGTDAGRDQLYRDFGTDMLPYIRYLLNNVDNEVNLSTRSGALQIAFTILDMESVDWMTEFLLTETLISKKVLSEINPEDGGWLDRFHNSEARSALAKVFLNLSDTVDQGELDAVLYHLIAILQWPVSLSDSTRDDPTTEQVYSRIVQLLEAGHFGSNNKALDYIKGASGNKGSGLMPLAIKIANSEQAELRHKMRWILVNNQHARNSIKEWAKEGGEENMLRLCLATNDLTYALFHSVNGPLDQEFGNWALGELKTSLPSLSLPESLNTWTADERDLEILAGMTSAKNPVLRFFAAHTLMQKGKQKEAVAFLLELGEDPTWASYFLKYWAQSSYPRNQITADSMKVLEPLTQSGPLVEEARLLLQENGGAILTKEIWKELDLEPSSAVVNLFFQRSKDSMAFDDLLWIMLNSDPTLSPASSSAAIFANRNPKGYLAAIPQLEKTGLRWDYLTAEWVAWRQGTKKFGSPFFVGEEVKYEEFSTVISAHYLTPDIYQDTLRYAPDAAMDFFARHLEDEKITSHLYKSAGVLKMGNLQSPTKAVQFSIALLQAGREDILNRNKAFFGALLDPKLKGTEAFFTIFWARNPLRTGLSQQFLHTTIFDTKLRLRFHNEMSQLLLVEAWAGLTCKEYEAVGAIDEILEDLLLAIKSDPTPKNLASFLSTISAVDDPRVVETLMRHLEDSRPLVHNAAATALDNLRASRIRKQEWSAWAAGNGSVSPIAALLQDLNDPEKEIRLAAIASLGTLRSTEALPALVDLLRDQDETIKAAARKALGRINTESNSQEKMLEDYKKATNQQAEPVGPKK